MAFCNRCIWFGFCCKHKVKLVTDKEINDPDFIRDVREKAFSLNICPDQWHDYLNDLYRDYPGWVRGTNGKEIYLAMLEFERPNIRDWFRDFCCTPCPEYVVPRVRCEARERVRILATILKAWNKDEAMMWGVRACNDNEPQN